MHSTTIQIMIYNQQDGKATKFIMFSSGSPIYQHEPYQAGHEIDEMVLTNGTQLPSLSRRRRNEIMKVSIKADNLLFIYFMYKVFLQQNQFLILSIKVDKF